MTREQEAAIVRKVLGGDANAFETLVLEYEKNVYNIALRMTGNSEDAADMTQEAFIKAYNSLQSFRGDSKFSVWLYRIVSNVCLDFLRSKNRPSRCPSRMTTARMRSSTWPTRASRPSCCSTGSSRVTVCAAGSIRSRRITGRYCCCGRYRG